MLNTFLDLLGNLLYIFGNLLGHLLIVIAVGASILIVYRLVENEFPSVKKFLDKVLKLGVKWNHMTI